MNTCTSPKCECAKRSPMQPEKKLRVTTRPNTRAKHYRRKMNPKPVHDDRERTFY